MAGEGGAPSLGRGAGDWGGAGRPRIGRLGYVASERECRSRLLSAKADRSAYRTACHNADVKPPIDAATLMRKRMNSRRCTRSARLKVNDGNKPVSFELGVTLQWISWRRALVPLGVLALTACKTPDHKTAVNKLTLPETQTACVAAGGRWVEPAPETIVSGCFLKTTDGGKSCTNSAQCQSKCVEHEDGNRCATSVDGCFIETARGTMKQCVN
jgi:hypothetical protein